VRSFIVQNNYKTKTCELNDSLSSCILLLREFILFFRFLPGAQDSCLQTVPLPEAAYIQLLRRAPEVEHGIARNM
jgi:hypothetical protein